MAAKMGIDHLFGYRLFDLPAFAAVNVIGAVGIGLAGKKPPKQPHLVTVLQLSDHHNCYFLQK